MKDIRGENDELKKMLKEMYKVHLSTLGTKNSTNAVQNHVYEDSGRDIGEGEEKAFDQIDIHFDQGNGVTQTTFRRKKANEPAQKSNTKIPVKRSQSPIPRNIRVEESDGQDQQK